MKLGPLAAQISDVAQHLPDRVVMIGATGTATTVAIGTVNAIIGVLVGLATLTYLTLKIYYLVRHNGAPRPTPEE